MATLALGVNPLIAGLSLFNLCLYTMVYTPMKRLTVWNTWLGSLVGAKPPMGGWAAATGAFYSGLYYPRPKYVEHMSWVSG